MTRTTLLWATPPIVLLLMVSTVVDVRGIDVRAGWALVKMTTVLLLIWSWFRIRGDLRTVMPDGLLSYPDPPLSDGRIGLRRWRDGDVECVRLAGADPDIPKLTTVPAAFTSTEGLAFIHRSSVACTTAKV